MGRLLKAEQSALQGRVQTEALISLYRTVVMPLSAFLEWRQREEFAGKQVAVLLPRELRPSWWEWPLQRRIAMGVRDTLARQDPSLLLVDFRTPWEPDARAHSVYIPYHGLPSMRDVVCVPWRGGYVAAAAVRAIRA